MRKYDKCGHELKQSEKIAWSARHLYYGGLGIGLVK